MLSADDLTLSTDIVLALCSFGLPVAVTCVAFGIAWIVDPIRAAIAAAEAEAR